MSKVEELASNESGGQHPFARPSAPAQSLVIKPAATFDQSQIDLIKSQIAKDATDDELKLFLYQCQHAGLDPLRKQIYFQKRWNKQRNCHDMIVITGIDGYRLIADRTGKYGGNDDPVFDSEEKPKKALVVVFKYVHGHFRPFSASARWDQYYPGETLGFMWRKMPHLMLGKCAEALALRKAFPQELSGVLTKEEMHQAREPDDALDLKETIVDLFPFIPEERKKQCEELIAKHPNDVAYLKKVLERLEKSIEADQVAAQTIDINLEAKK